MILLLWAYYSAQIVFLGAEFTQVYASRYGSKIEPADNAVPVVERKEVASANEWPPAKRAEKETGAPEHPLEDGKKTDHRKRAGR